MSPASTSPMARTGTRRDDRPFAGGLPRTQTSPIAILQDLSGPKVRVGKIAGDGVPLKPGAEITLTQDDVPGDDHEINLPVPEIFEAVQATRI